MPVDEGFIKSLSVLVHQAARNRDPRLAVMDCGSI